MKQRTHAPTLPLIQIQRDQQTIELEYQLIQPQLHQAPLLIFLHEGLGSVSMWRNWPEQVCNALRCRGLVYSRYGYGQSTIRAAHDTRTSHYLHDEARHDLPAMLTALGLDDERPILYGHSDGASIALLYAAIYPERVQAIAVAAPHIFVEEITIEGIRAARKAYENTDLITRLGRYHRDPDSVFLSWNDTWLTDEFRQWNIESFVRQIRCPILAIQGIHDEYGTLAQIRDIQHLAPQTRLCIISDCGHSPHRDQSERVIGELGQFIHDFSTDTP